MRNLSTILTVVLVVILSFSPGCLNHSEQLNNTNDNTTPPAVHTDKPSTRAFSSYENESIQSAAPSSLCNETKFDEIFRITRTEAPFSGKTPLIEVNITRAVEELGPDFKIPGYVPEGFYFHYVTLPEWNSKENKIVLVFVNTTHEGHFVTLKSSNQIYIAFSRNVDLEFREFIDQEPEFVCINGTPGFHYTSPDGNKLRWLDGNVERWIVGSFNHDLLIRVADSMRSPSDLDLTSEVYSGNTSWIPGTFPPGITVPVTPAHN